MRQVGSPCQCSFALSYFFVSMCSVFMLLVLLCRDSSNVLESRHPTSALCFYGPNHPFMTDAASPSGQLRRHRPGWGVSGSTARHPVLMSSTWIPWRELLTYLSHVAVTPLAMSI